MSKEIIDLLESSRMAGNTHLLPNVSYYAVNPEKFNQALDLLKQQSIEGDFTKEIRASLAISDAFDQTAGKSSNPLIKPLLEACDRLDSAEARLKELLEKSEDLLKALGPFARLADMIPATHAPDHKWEKFYITIRSLPLDRYREAWDAVAKAKKVREI